MDASSSPRTGAKRPRVTWSDEPVLETRTYLMSPEEKALKIEVFNEIPMKEMRANQEAQNEAMLQHLQQTAEMLKAGGVGAPAKTTDTSAEKLQPKASNQVSSDLKWAPNVFQAVKAQFFPEVDTDEWPADSLDSWLDKAMRRTTTDKLTKFCKDKKIEYTEGPGTTRKSLIREIGDWFVCTL